MDKELRVFRIEVNFDLSMDLLDAHYPGGRNNRKSAYDKIGRYFEENGFEHALYSGYASKWVYNDEDIVLFVNDFFDSLDWAEKCMRVCHVTIIHDNIIDALHLRKMAKKWSREDELEFSFESNEKKSLDDKIKYCERKIEEYSSKANTYKKVLKKLKEEKIK